MPKSNTTKDATQKRDHEPKSAQQGSARWNGRFSITITLMTAIGLLTLISVGSVLGIGAWLAQKNTFELLSNNAHQRVSAAVNRVRQHLKPAEYQAEYIARRIVAGDVDPSDPRQMSILLSGSLAAAPQIDTVLFINKQMQAQFANHNSKTGKVVTGVLDYSSDPIILARVANLKPGANWGAPIWGDAPKKTYLNLTFPVSQNGKLLGTIIAAVTVRALSSFVVKSQPGYVGMRFILSGRTHVLAHPMMMRGYPGLSAKSPLPQLKGFKDKFLAAIWRQEDRHDLKLKLPKGTHGHMVGIDGQRYIFIYQKLYGYGPEPLIAGAYFRGVDVGKEVRRLATALIAGLIALVLSLLAAILLGRKIAQPIVRFSAAARSIRNLDISQVAELPGSYLRELNDQSGSFNTMLRALRWFELYVPKTIVAHLVKRGDASINLYDARSITVMFTDMVSFSTISQGMSAHEVADLVNHHFTLIGACIDAESGTIDKFMGDSVMAFWGAPEKQKRRAERACRAALAIAAAIRKDNKTRISRGKDPIGIRIGIHTGSATVGNIGAPGRINYTIIGDTVNIGQRLEQLGKEIYPPGSDVAILISGDTVADLGKGFKTILAGSFKLKGRDGEVEVYKLL